ncbi:RagB/SusD family nutrient uptake outer membrane protein [Hymenobacter cellulosilyticus]|uniref:RagB/SusD family nutrient uptake outer membrane protein n=1 Tax=Hymenobacter cellulosilyticus TaxID=2932248 RepID=A0A8T9QFF3_9BACT|nr:RagB/SusD family nutrient uptake outer membrane protein [Hymenobacter cellulosilyticus]UOQ74279.1 RagB/SusD family nutrient uptake outer membrane protein [Hymenobacter cellulosilyticus]
MNTLVKKKLTIAVCSTFLALGTFSCQEELLDPIPRTQFSDAVVFDTPTRVDLQANAMYSFVKAGTFLGGRYQVYGDIRADDFINRNTNGVTGLSVWNHTLTPTSANDVVTLWNAGYAAINQINVFLAGLEANKAKFVAPVFKADYATTTAVYYQGEAKLLRALSYYSLLQLYARPYADGKGSKPGLPLRLRAEKDDTGNDLARSSVADVYKQILLDLDDAEKLLPLTQTPAGLNNSRAHRNTAIALKTRVYLSMGDYANVVKEADKIVSATAPFKSTTGVAHALLPNVASVFTPGTTESGESILAFPFTAQNAPGTQNQLGYYFSPGTLGGNGEFSLNTAPGSIYANTTAWAANDARRTSLVTKAGNDFYVTKYPTPTPFTDRAPVIRYAEVLLSLAEARVRTAGPGDAQALALLNAVRGRSNPAGVYTGFSSADEFVNAILLERRIEFLAEGLRNIDIMRFNATIPGKGTISEVPNTSPLYIWPIPQSELLGNKLMTENN